MVPAIDRLTKDGAIFENGVEEDFDAIIMTTGYTSSVCSWLKVYQKKNCAFESLIS